MPFPITQPEVIDVGLQFALQMRDGYADSDQLLGTVTAESGPVDGQQKESSGSFLFYDLQPGAQNISVSSDPETPYYLPTQVAVNVVVPPPLWPAFPDITIANPTLPLGDPGQTPVYKAQRLAATLFPTVAYPFPLGATLIRGTVLNNATNLPLPATTVQDSGGTVRAYVTGADGQFVLYFANPPAAPINIVAAHAGMANGNANNITVLRGLTVSVTIKM